MVNKSELIAQIIEEYTSILSNTNKHFKVFMYNTWELEQIIRNALDKYLLVDEEKLRSKLVVVEKDMNMQDIHFKKFETNLRLALTADRDDLLAYNDQNKLKEFIEQYVKDTFINTLDKTDSESEINLTAAQDHIKLMNLLANHGIETYDKAKAYFDRQKFESDARVSEELAQYYNHRSW